VPVSPGDGTFVVFYVWSRFLGGHFLFLLFTEGRADDVGFVRAHSCGFGSLLRDCQGWRGRFRRLVRRLGHLGVGARLRTFRYLLHVCGKALGKALTEVGFKLLPPRKDATRDEMLFAVYELASQLRTSGAAGTLRSLRR
jgi:hypothetical protein